MKQREFIGILESVVTWPLVAQAQPQPTPVVGFPHVTTLEATLVAEFIRGLPPTILTGRRSIVKWQTA